jgi:hypothetical protein
MHSALAGASQEGKAMSVETVASSAIISEDEVYRYRLGRELAGDSLSAEGCSPFWKPAIRLALSPSWWPSEVPVRRDGPVLGVLMVNPSKADHLANDPTITRILHFARDWGVRHVIVGNEFARRATDIKELRAFDAERNEGPNNDVHLQAIVQECDLLLVGWGPRAKLPPHLQRHWKHTVDLTGGKPLYCLGIAQDGHPRHPLMVKANVSPTRWSPP